MAAMDYKQIMLLAGQWDIYSEPKICEQGAIFDCFGGKRRLRAVPMAEAAFCHYLQRHLYSRGFAGGLRFIPNKYGDAYGIWEDKGVYLTDHFETSYHLQSEYDLWRLAAILAEFHNAAENFFIPGAPLDTFQPPLEYALWLAEQPPPPMTAHVLPLYERLCEQCRYIIDKADDGVFRDLCEEVKKHGLIVQGRFNEFALQEHYGELFIADYSAASYGLPIWDLAYLLGRGLLVLGRDSGIIAGAIAEYNKRRHLTSAEKHLLNRLIKLPMEFIFAISDWQEQRLTGEGFAEILLQEDRIFTLREKVIIK